MDRTLGLLADVQGWVNQGQEKTILFCHIPKTAGSSLGRTIQREYWVWQRLPIYKGELDPQQPDPVIVKRIQRRKNPYRIIYGHFSYGTHDYLSIQADYFAFFREPVARVASLYDQLAKPESPFYQQIRDGLTLREMVLKKTTEMTNNHMTRVISGAEVRPGVLLTDEAFLERAKANIREDFFFVGTVETIQPDFAELARLLSWRSKSVPRINVSPKRASEMDTKTREVVLEYNQLDVKLYEWIRERKNSLNSARDKRA